MWGFQGLVGGGEGGHRRKEAKRGSVRSAVGGRVGKTARLPLTHCFNEQLRTAPGREGFVMAANVQQFWGSDSDLLAGATCFK